MEGRRASELYFEELGPRFDALMSGYDVGRRQELIARLLPGAAGSAETLEVGCGTGAISRFLRNRVGPLTVSDLSAKLAQAVGEELGCRWRAIDVCRPDVGPHRFDLVVSSELVEHTPDPRQAIRNMAGMLRPGGWLLLTTPNRLWYPVLLLAEALKIRRFRGNEIWLWPRAIRRELAAAGLAVVTEDGCHLVPWQIPGSQSILPLIDRFGSTLHPLMINVGVLARRP